MNAETRIRRGYARKAEIARAIAAVRDAGVAIGEVELGSDGTIRIHAERSRVDNAFDRWQAERRKAR